MKSAEATVIQELIEIVLNMEGWLLHPDIRFKICDGGRGNLGEQADYQQLMNRVQKTKKLAQIVADADKTFTLLADIVDDADNEGCEEMFTVASCYIEDAGQHVRRARNESATSQT